MENFLKIILQTTTGETIDLDFTGPVLSSFWWLLTEFWWLWSICVVLVILSQIANSKPRKNLLQKPKPTSKNLIETLSSARIQNKSNSPWTSIFEVGKT